MGKISVTKTVGKSTFTFIVDEEKFKEGLEKAAFYATTPDKCTVCGSEEVTLDSNRTKEGYLYIKIRCLNESCKATSTLGIYKDNSGGFWKEFEKYEGDSSSSETKTEKKETEEPKETTKKKEDDDFSF